MDWDWNAAAKKAVPKLLQPAAADHGQQRQRQRDQLSDEPLPPM